MNALRNEIIYTIDDIYALPDGERAELIDGQIYYMAPPSRTHQRISSYLHNELYNYIQKNHGNCEVYAAPFAVFPSKDSTSYVEPDLSLSCDPGLLDEKGCHGAPDWIIEIVSPSSKSMDYFRKLFLYRTCGVREYWIVDPAKQLVTAYQLDNETVEHYSFGDDIPVAIWEGFSIKLI